MEQLKDIYFLENSLFDYGLFLLFIVVALVVKRPLTKRISAVVAKIFEKYGSDVSKEKLFDLLKKPGDLFFILLIGYYASTHVSFPESWDLNSKDTFGLKMVLHKSYLTLLIVSLTWFLLRIVDYLSIVLIKNAEKENRSKKQIQLIPFMKEFLKIIFGIFGIFIILGTVFSLDIGTLVAGIGIGGLALALAAKESLENLLASFTIFFDEPFVVGDLVQVGSVIGVVEKIGFRSTRIRTLEKSYLTLPNKKMVDSELDNLSLRTFRRSRFQIGILYSTPIEKIKLIVAEIKEYLDQHPNTNQDGTAKFFEFGDSSLEILVQYFVDTMDWNVYLDVKQEINFKIIEIVRKHGSEFAFPSRSIYKEN